MVDDVEDKSDDRHAADKGEEHASALVVIRYRLQSDKDHRQQGKEYQQEHHPFLHPREVYCATAKIDYNVAGNLKKRHIKLRVRK